jgi:hypothetical protein
MLFLQFSDATSVWISVSPSVPFLAPPRKVASISGALKDRIWKLVRVWYLGDRGACSVHLCASPYSIRLGSYLFLRDCGQ